MCGNARTMPKLRGDKYYVSLTALVLLTVRITPTLALEIMSQPGCVISSGGKLLSTNQPE